jgi:hypothetical protein
LSISINDDYHHHHITTHSSLYIQSIHLDTAYTTAVHPSPVASNFFDKVHKLESLEMAQKSAVSPASVPGKMLMCVGRCHYGDLGEMAVGVRVVTALVPYDFLAGVFSFAAPYLGDYKKHNINRGKSD